MLFLLKGSMTLCKGYEPFNLLLVYPFEMITVKQYNKSLNLMHIFLPDH